MLSSSQPISPQQPLSTCTSEGDGCWGNVAGCASIPVRISPAVIKSLNTHQQCILTPISVTSCNFMTAYEGTVNPAYVEVRQLDNVCIPQDTTPLCKEMNKLR